MPIHLHWWVLPLFSIVPAIIWFSIWLDKDDTGAGEA